VNIWFNGAARSQGGGPTCVSKRGGGASGSLANPRDGLAGSRVRHTRRPNRRASRVINFSVGRWLTAQTLKKRRPGGAGPSAVHGSSGAGALGDAIAPLPFIFRRWVPGLRAAAQVEAPAREPGLPAAPFPTERGDFAGPNQPLSLDSTQIPTKKKPRQALRGFSRFLRGVAGNLWWARGTRPPLFRS